ncbi:transcription factor cwo isoform X3 [Pieris brassicae]|uniref:transcription factor cwo isoform X3 n=1 Tax=Pieris brassicae TaxID=7116 RepID=UPI001E660015|nr:transcription factor cwo isoform X3 [Pieris brassicae]
METRHYWEENGHTVKYDSYNSNDGFGRPSGDQLNFSARSEDEGDYIAGSAAYLKKGKVSRASYSRLPNQDPMSHRIIEKRRRDRMNNCLADLSRLIPPEYLKKGRGRVEKTEIIEMAIRHLKFLQDRVNAAERQVVEDHFKAGYQEAVGEAVRFLVEVQGFGPADGLCVQLASHMQRHCEGVTKGEVLLREKVPRSQGGSSSETASSSGSSHGYAMKGVIQHPEPPPTFPREPFEPERQIEAYPMECERVSVGPIALVDNSIADQPLPLDGRCKRSPTLRKVRKPEHGEDFLHSYKFKNSIERRFSRSQDNEAAQQIARPTHAHKVYNHKRRRATKPAPSTSTSASGSTEDARDTSPQDTSSESPHHHQYEKPLPPTQFVPVFALNALGKYYVPLSVDYSCLARHLGPYDVLDARAVQLSAPLHPVTIHVNFQPCLNYHVKREPNERDWRPA